MDDNERRDASTEPVADGQPDAPAQDSADAPDEAMYAPDVTPEPSDEPVALPEAALDGVETVAAANTLEPSISEKAKRTRQPDGDETRIEVLSLAIERYPDAAVNYVLRGEAWLALGDDAKALDDFRAALALADDAASSARWGYVEQALADRAREGLRQLGR